MKTILTIIGTRPEVIKLAPVLHALNKSNRFKSEVCSTQQHSDLLDPLLSDLQIDVNYMLENPKESSTLPQSFAHILKRLGALLETIKPDLLLVQGDTTTAFAGALAAYYSRIPVGHVEAGLRTGNIYSPWPEEGHRCVVDQLTTYFFTPTLQALNSLQVSGVSPEKAWVVGNTSIDAIRLLRGTSDSVIKVQQTRMIIVTAHRRENHGEALKQICSALRHIAEKYSDVRIVFFLHPNPAVHLSVKESLSEIENIELREPVDHQTFVQFLNEGIFIISDSGGIQEEAPFLGRPVLITRDTTERPEGIQAGTARLVGTKASNIIAACEELLENAETLARMSKVHFPYGDGYAAERIVNILEMEL